MQRRPFVLGGVALLVVGFMAMGNILQFVGAPRAMRDVRATGVAELNVAPALL